MVLLSLMKKRKKKRKQNKMINKINNHIVEQIIGRLSDPFINSAWDGIAGSQRYMYDVWETIYISMAEAS